MIDEVTLRIGTPRDVIIRVAGRFPSISKLVLDNLDADNSIISFVIDQCKHLRYLQIANCHKVSWDAFHSARSDLVVRAPRCWRLATPNTSLSALEVVELQLLALQGNKPEYSDGVKAVFDFISPEFKRKQRDTDITSDSISPGLRRALGCRYFHVSETSSHGDPRRKSFVAFVHTYDGVVQKYVFVISRQLSGEYSGCWMTERIFSFVKCG
eukprot:CAMPEP_0113946468 /NCGR_PEP_ID=MMETSP1339-20121228/57726_1 /TAXON_ID=94617 /ORGANISM="Fibrocapsa japonica" /LENGTH=211 /DNA_ID=CAMNT_0000952565 /DNA_START=53 /DNA_END=688 /DNA_ORIENTATION=+ /assembly_acc=CAM_ASM_000762